MDVNRPEIKQDRFFDPVATVWIVPIIALIIALWLAWQHYSKVGPEIEIIFPKNRGLEAGKSLLKFKDVPIGKVTKIELDDDGKSVRVYVEIKKSAEEFFNEEAKFWIVTPRVGLTGVSGLETLVTGPYIEMHGVKKGFSKQVFYGLKNPYREVEQGEYFHLRAPEAYNVIKGTPIYFKNLKVGQVEYVMVSLDGKGVDFIIFVDKYYSDYIHTDSKFWVMSALDIDISNGRLDVNVAPIGHLLHSGIAFSSSGQDKYKKVPDDYVFYLYKNKTLANQKKIGQGGESIKTYRMYTDDSVAKLSVNAPIRFDGYDVGHVKEVNAIFDIQKQKMRADILLNIDTSSFADTLNSGEENLERAIRQGLRARVAKTDPITGLLYVELAFVDDSTVQKVPKAQSDYPIFPSTKASSSDAMRNLNRIMENLAKIDLQGVSEELESLLKESRNTVQGIKKPLIHTITSLKVAANELRKIAKQKELKVMPKRIDKILIGVDATLKDAKKMIISADKAMRSAQKSFESYSGDSVMAQKLTRALESIDKTSKQMEAFLRMLNRKPNSLIFGDQ